ncbi:MAG TPA: hypothetical protein VFW20_06845, partial [Candidatus Limnocylindrales bacterium]|nr:hypothetical protein [Candidatus Limnocylindrales bacterium]
MTEILTESFCERCGTRYTFETVQQRGRPLKRVGTLSRGLKNFLVDPDSSIGEALAAARTEDEQRATAAQLEAFHRTFNFCLQCRQYTCSECWNSIEGRCLTCAPLPIEEIVIPAAEGPVSAAVIAQTITYPLPAAASEDAVGLTGDRQAIDEDSYRIFATGGTALVDEPAAPVDEPAAPVDEPASIVDEGWTLDEHGRFDDELTQLDEPLPTLDAHDLELRLAGEDVAEPRTEPAPLTEPAPAPEPAAAAEPEAAVAAEPEAAVTAEPEAAVAAEPEAAVTAEPEA